MRSSTSGEGKFFPFSTAFRYVHMEGKMNVELIGVGKLGTIAAKKIGEERIADLPKKKDPKT